ESRRNSVGMLLAPAARRSPPVNALRLALVIIAVAARPVLAQGGQPDGNWTMAAHDYAGTRFSPLDQINAANVGKLSLAFTFSTGVLRGHEAAPVVVDDTLYLVTPFPNVVYALDLTKPGAPMKWKFSVSVVVVARPGV